MLSNWFWLKPWVVLQAITGRKFPSFLLLNIVKKQNIFVFYAIFKVWGWQGDESQDHKRNNCSLLLFLYFFVAEWIPQLSSVAKFSKKLQNKEVLVNVALTHLTQLHRALTLTPPQSCMFSTALKGWVLIRCSGALWGWSSVDHCVEQHFNV